MKEINKHILELFSAYFDETISKNQYTKLCNWLEEAPENKEIFSEYLRLYKKSKQIGFAQSVDMEEAWSKVLKKINQPIDLSSISEKTNLKTRYLKPVLNSLKYAAVFVVLIGVAYFFSIQNDTIDVQDGQLIISNEDITLELENGNIKVINSDVEEKIIDKSGKVVGTQRDNILAYDTESDVEKLIYNKLSVPYGKKFQIVLSDGTKVYLNAGTSLKYPVNFLKGKNRQVYLLSGEAYFDVTKDTKHPFIVNTHEMCIRVLGTEFNVSSYPEDLTISTVLVEGLVNLVGKDTVFNADEALLLKPGYMANWNKSNKEISINKVDTSLYTSWKNGKLIFKNIQFKNIIKKLERHYNVSIINNNKELDQQYYYATFDKENIEQVLNSFNKSYEIKYTIENNKIIIN